MRTNRGRSPAGTSLLGRAHRARLQRSQDDGGFTIVESVVTLAIVSIVIGLVLGYVTNLFQQSTNVGDTMAGVQQDQTAGEGLLQYLHAAIVILPGSNATTLDASILDGVTSGTPQTATFQAVQVNSANPSLDATFQTSISPTGGYCPLPPATPNASCRSINDYDVVNSSTVFTYYYNSNSTTTTTGSCPANFACTSTPTNAQLSEIVAVGVDVTFLAGPHKPKAGFQAVRRSSFQTTVYLQNASGAPAPTSSVSVSGPSGTPSVGSPLTATATVSPVPDGGFVNFTVTLGASTLSVCTSAVYVSTTDGTATCTFIPAVGGTYDVSAAFSGTGDFQPSTSSVTAITVPISTTTTLSVTPASGQLSLLATVVASDGSTPTGSVLFKITSGSFFGTCSSFSPCTSTVPLNSSAQASWVKTGLSNSTSYSITATFTDSTGTYASSSASGSGQP
jgi:prepilin-type N-terminal cleavage/methylation domain-containing protein